MRLPNAILAILNHFRPEFSRPTWKRVPTLFAGTLLTRGRRTVTAALRAVGLANATGYQRFHEVFSRAAWSPLRLARRLLGLVVAAFAPEGGLTFVIDETLERRRGPKITKRSHHRDPIASSKKMTVVASGLRWMVTALVVPIPWASRHWALPVLSQLAPSEKTDKKQKRRHKTLSRRAAFIARLLRRWLPTTDLTLLGDSTYSVIALGRSCQKRQVRLIAPLPWKACLHHEAPPRTATTMGRPRKVGAALTKLHAMLSDPATTWTATKVLWPDGTRRPLELASGQALWNESGEVPLSVRWVVVRDPAGRWEPRTFFSTEPSDEAAEVVGRFARRWTIEVTFQEARAHLGVESQRQWCDRSIERETPCLLGLYSVVALLAKGLTAAGDVPHQATAWYAKARATFADCLAVVRQHLWGVEDFCEPGSDQRFAKIRRCDLERLKTAVCYSH